MNVDHNEFFIEATLRVTSGLEIEKALYRCFEYIREFIPADRAILTHYDPGTRVINVIAMASNQGGQPVDMKFPLSRESGILAEPEKMPLTILENSADTHPLTHRVARKVPGKNGSLLLVGLMAQEKRLGGISLWADENDRFTQDHMDLLLVLQKPLTIVLSNCLRYRELVELKEALADDNRYLRRELNRTRSEKIIGADCGLKDVIEQVRQVASLKSPVIILGETGVGKEMIANAVHDLSPRRNDPFIKVDCGAIPPTLIDSELFGHEKGAFTGALDKKRGRFERADHGTIFLDEIGELPLNAQVRLLRVLQEKEINRVGGSETIKLDIRIIAATHRNLTEMIQQGRFREDLYFRLMVFPIVIPPLRQRKNDIPELVYFFVRKKSREMGIADPPALAPGAIERLMAYSWPGNVRDLENAVERALIMSNGDVLTFTEFTNVLKTTTDHDPALYRGPENYETHKLNVVISQHIRRVLKLTDGKIAGRRGAAELLDLHPATLRHRMRKLDIPFGRKANYSKAKA